MKVLSKIVTNIYIVFACFLLCTASAYAQYNDTYNNDTYNDDTYTDDGQSNMGTVKKKEWYVSIAAVLQNNVNFFNDTSSTKAKAHGYHLGLGYRIHDYIDIEMAFTMQDDYSDTEYNVFAWSLEWAALIKYPLKRFEPYLRIAYSYSELEETDRGTSEIMYKSKHSNDLNFGVGVDFEITKSLGLRFDYTFGNKLTDSGYNRIILGVLARF